MMWQGGPERPGGGPSPSRKHPSSVPFHVWDLHSGPCSLFLFSVCFAVYLGLMLLAKIKDQYFTNAFLHHFMTCFCLMLKGAGSRNICLHVQCSLNQSVCYGWHHVLGAAGTAGICQSHSINPGSCPQEEPQTHQQGKQDRVTITLSLGRGRPRAGVQRKVGKCSQLGSLVPKGFLEEVVFELGLNKLGH